MDLKIDRESSYLLVAQRWSPKSNIIAFRVFEIDQVLDLALGGWCYSDKLMAFVANAIGTWFATF